MTGAARVALAPSRGPARLPRRSPAPATARPRHLTVIDPAARKRERRTRILVRASVLAVVLAVLAAVSIHVVMAEGQLRLERIAAQTTTEQQNYERLRLQFALERSPQAIVERATRLGMVTAAGLRYLSVPGVVTEGADGASGSGAASESSLGKDWGKVKPHLAAQP